MGVRWRPPLAVAIVTHLVTQSLPRARNGSGRSRMRLAMRLGLTSSLMFDDGRKADCIARREGSRDQPESMLLSLNQATFVCAASVGPAEGG